MAEKGFVSKESESGRINAHNEIIELPFTSNIPYSIMIIPKANIADGVISTPDNVGILVNVKTYQSDAASDLPVMFNAWTEANIVEIPAGAIDLVSYRVFRGSGL
ncbi:hypothetical protein [Mariniphaga sediminis]|uniref:hypothetical protein n=1 Tax=Mariniphaga sediminis TaxID=1628158 RepID=UPI003568A186